MLLGGTLELPLGLESCVLLVAEVCYMRSIYRKSHAAEFLSVADLSFHFWYLTFSLYDQPIGSDKVQIFWWYQPFCGHTCCHPAQNRYNE